MSNLDPVAAFLARGGKIQKVATGKTTLELTDRQWFNKVREPAEKVNYKRNEYNTADRRNV